MDETEFLRLLPAWSEGSLDDVAADGMAAYVDANPAAVHLAESHDAFDRRVRDALLEGVDGHAVVQRFLAEARVPATVGTQKPFSRHMLALRVAASLAAALLVAFSFGWFYCIGPFECAYLEALERARDEPAVDRGAAFAVPAVEPPGAQRLGDRVTVQVSYRAPRLADLSRYEMDGSELTVLWCQSGDALPSFRRRVKKDGQDWWVADENGIRMVAFFDAPRSVLCCVMGDLPQERLLAVADGLRCACR
jgi:hypothetical protein